MPTYVWSEDFHAHADPAGWTWTNPYDSSGESGVFVREYVDQVVPGYGLTPTLRITQQQVAQTYQNPRMNTAVLITLEAPGTLTFEASYENPNTTYAPVQAGAVVGFYSYGKNFYGHPFEAEAFYTQPGWHHYEIAVPAGTFGIYIEWQTPIAAASAWNGPATFAISHLALIQGDDVPDAPPTLPPPARLSGRMDGRGPLGSAPRLDTADPACRGSLSFRLGSAGSYDGLG